MIKIQYLKDINPCIGMEIRIKKDLKSFNFYGGIFFNKKMAYFCGKKATITIVNKNVYGCGTICRLDIDSSAWTWHESMLER